MTKQTPVWECSSCPAQVGDYLQAGCFVRPLPKGHEARLPFVLLFPPLKREEPRMLPLPESWLTSAQPSDPTPPLPFFQLLLLLSCLQPSLFSEATTATLLSNQFQWLGRGINSFSCLAFPCLPI